MESNRFPVVLNKSQDFKIIYKKGRRVHPCSWLTVNYKSNDLGQVRVGWTVPCYVGKAVVRNKLKRWCREFIRSKAVGFENKSIDTNIVFRKSQKEFYKKLKFVEFEKELERAYAKII